MKIRHIVTHQVVEGIYRPAWGGGSVMDQATSV